ncbi:helix-turn-helix transcriptional regulator [Ectothiorhodospiraceae bacterium 2226]|nr:helix-turn-helix transcriptional regulator [Ectothiorhodospiraceae bacterium 2226]
MQAPAVALRDRVVQYRSYSETFAPPYRHLELARGQVVMVIGSGAPLRLQSEGAVQGHHSFVVGPDHRPLFAEFTGPRACIEIILPPWAARELLGEPVLELGGRPAPLDELLGAEAQRLGLQLAATRSGSERFALLDSFFRRRAARAGREARAEIRWAWARLAAAGGALPVADLSRTLGWSHRHFVARFREHTGLTPKAAARWLRLGRAAELLRQDPRVALGGVAAACGYADQSHFTREFRALGGCTPRAYRHHLEHAARRVTFVQDAHPP